MALSRRSTFDKVNGKQKFHSVQENGEKKSDAIKQRQYYRCEKDGSNEKRIGVGEIWAALGVFLIHLPREGSRHNAPKEADADVRKIVLP